MQIVLALLCSVLLTNSVAVATESYSLEDATKFRQAFTMDNWDDGGELMRYVFLNMPEFWKHSVIHRGEQVRELPLAPQSAVAGFTTSTDMGEMAISDYVEKSTVNGAIVVHRGDIVFEAYPRMRPTDKHLHMSVSKAYSATLIAILEDREMIDVTKDVDHYLPTLSESGWAGVSIIDVLDMASGIGCLEGEEGAYDNPERCYYQYEASLGWLRATDDTLSSPFEYMATLESHRPSGEAFEYTSPNTFILGWLAEVVSDTPYAELVSREIWQPAGAQADGMIVAPRNGVPIASGGISSTLRDVARFGLLFTPSGRAGTNPVVSDRYLDRIQSGGRPEIFAADDEPDDVTRIDGEIPRHNTYQWDFVMSDGDFFKGGYGGQGLYVSPTRDLVIAFFGTFDDDGEDHEMTRIARQLAKSGLFPRQSD